ncbi:contractile injection system tape measure protein [Fluviicola sp.]|uniref:contractile injection system tape measure protein n=1 Tax=Fluviicola sp. TaxID=1917219 RepID=UPI0031E32A9D
MNGISSISLHVTASNESFVQNWYRDFELFAEKHITAVADRVLMRCDQYGFEIEISRLDIDLGNIPEEDFEQDFERILEEKLEESLLKEILYPAKKEDKRLEEADYQFEALKQFLLHGTMNWNLARRFGNITELFRQVLKNRTKELSSFLKSYGHFTSLQHRMIYQFEDASLFDTVKLIAPSEFSFIRSYITFLRVKYAEIPNIAIREEERRVVIWKVVYGYLLSNQSATFNKKLFVRETIGNLASHINVSYRELLKTLTFLLEKGFGSVIPSGLQLILNELKQEETTSFMALRVQKPDEWPHILREMKASGRAIKLHENELDQLRVLLENEKNVLQIIKPLRETEIFDLVRLLVPSDATFVIEYAQHLNKQHQSGALQGKSSGEFLLFKWQVILPILALSKSPAVNREYLVWQVFKRLSARYNIEIWQIITFAYNETGTWKIHHGLREIIQQFYLELVQGKPKSEQTRTFDSINFQLQLLEKRTKLSKDQLRELKTKLSSLLFRELLLDRLGESARHRLLAIILPSKAIELSAFMYVLNHSGKDAKIEGRTIGSIQRLKWSFLFDVLEEVQGQVFNQEHIVRRILEKTGAHYNLTLNQLIDYFYLDFRNSNFSLPFNLFKTLSSIRLKIEPGDTYRTERLKSYSKKQLENRKLLVHYFTENAQNMPMINAISQDLEWMDFLSPILDAAKRIVDFIQRKWNVRINNQFLLQTIFRFSKNATHRSQRELMAEVWNLIQKSLTRAQKVQLVKELMSPNEPGILLKQLSILLEKDPELIAAQKEALAEEAMDEEELPEEAVEEETGKKVQFIDNAGLVLLAPFLPRLFSMLELTENGKFRDRDAQIKAIFLTQYAVFGDGEFPEYALQLNKLLTRFKTGIPIPRISVLTDEDKQTVDGMLEGVLQNWGRLANTSIAGLQEGFLRREGRLEELEDTFLLTVEAKGYDMLLDHVPWNFRTIKFSWMQKGLQVKWR